MWGSVALVALLGGHFALSLPEVWRVRTNDFPAYWAAGQAILSGRADLLYAEQWKWFTNLPAVSVLFAPLALLPYESAWRLLWWLQLGSYAATFGLLLAGIRRFFVPLTPPRVALAALVFFAFAPVLRRCLALGQTTPLMVVLLAGVWWALRAGWPRLGGLGLGLVCTIKIPPLLLLPLLGLRRRLAVLATALAVVVLALLASWLFFGTELLGQYADRVILDNLGRVHAAFNNQSLDGAFMRLLTDRGLADWQPVPRPAGVAAAVYGCVALLAALLVACAGRLLWPAAAPPDTDPDAGGLELELALGTALMCLVFPIVWIHYYLFLVVPLCLLPFWALRRGLAVGWPSALLFAAGVGLAGGPDVHENAFYAAREAEPAFRAALGARPLGALLLVLSLLAPLRALALEERDRALRSPACESPPGT